MWDEFPQITREACKVFYGCNTYHLYDEDVLPFLDYDTNEWEIHGGYGPDVCRIVTGRPKFEVRSYVKKFLLMIEPDSPCPSIRRSLWEMLGCRGFQYLYLDMEHISWRGMDDESKEMLTEVYERIGKGFRSRCYLARKWVTPGTDE